MGQQRCIAATGQMGKKPAVLLDIAHFVPHVQGIVVPQRRSIDHDLAGVGRNQPHQDAQQSRFAASTRSDHHDGFPLRDVQTQWLQNLGGPVGFRYVFQTDHHQVGAAESGNRSWTSRSRRVL